MSSNYGSVIFILVLTFFLPLNVSGFEFAGGSGSPNDPYQIATAQQLIDIGKDPNLYHKHFILVADIDLDPNLPGRKIFDGAVIAPDVNQVDPSFQGPFFTGSFDGGGHCITRLTIDAMNTTTGLFGCIGEHAMVQRVRLLLTRIIGKGTPPRGHSYCVGTLAGKNLGTITACYCQGIVEGYAIVGGLVANNFGSIVGSSTDIKVFGVGAVGGLVGYNTGIIRRCFSKGFTNGGGLVGLNYNEISFSYSHTEATRGGLVGSNLGGHIAYSYATGKSSRSDDFIGGLVGECDDGTVYSCYWDIESSERTTSGGGIGKTTAQMQSLETFPGWGYEGTWVLDDDHDYPRLHWENSPGNPIVDKTPRYTGGLGDVNDPYRLASVEDMIDLAYYAEDWDKHFVLDSNIVFLRESQILPFPIGNAWKPFSGVFDGRQYEIIDLTLKRPAPSPWPARCGYNHTGLFGVVSRGDFYPNWDHGIVRNLILTRASIQGRDFVGALVATNKGTVENCLCIEVQVEGNQGVGGLVGVNHGKIRGCHVSGRVKASDDYVGGLIGMHRRSWGREFYRDAYTEFCSASCQVSGDKGVGGLIGHSSASLHCSFAEGSVQGDEGVGGLLGYLCSDIYKCFSLGLVTGNINVGGLVGVSNKGGRDSSPGKIISCYSLAQVQGISSLGGLVGQNAGTVNASYCAGTVKGQDQVGGFVGLSVSPFAIYEGVNFWNNEIAGTKIGITPFDVDTLYGLSTAQMLDRSTYLNASWDFNDTWMICIDEYPRLQWEQWSCNP